MTCFNRVKNVLAILLVGALAAGCETKAGTGAIVGGLGGAAVGGLIGNNNGSTAGGAAIGAAVGAAGGALVGHAMDQNDKKKARERERDRYYDDYAVSDSRSAKITQRDVIEWNSRGVRDDVIIDRIERSGQTFRLTGADENALRDAGVSERVIRAMKNTARR